ncbi:MAG: class I SAM-dependent methyltransferase [Nanoarchaeota archaeon]|nr:class I SAM-dependent methyltransferase [Nanoarchaeota archaeon]
MGREQPAEWSHVLRFLGLPAMPIFPESGVGDHVPEERAELFHALTHSGTELESLLMLHALVLSFKPELILETGTDTGLGTLALASAAAKNGFGKVVTVDNDEQKYRTANAAFRSAGLERYVESHLSGSLEYIGGLPAGTSFGMVFFDSRSRLRIPEFEALYARGALGNLAVFHDTSKHRITTQPHKGTDVLRAYLGGLDRIAKEYCTGEIVMPYSRGMRIMQVKPLATPLTSSI